VRKLGEHPWLVDLTLLLVAVVWGSSYLTTKEVVTPATVIAVLALRFAISVPGMALFSLSGLRRLNSAEVWIGGLLGLILSLVFLLETFGVTKTSATNAGLIISLTIVITPMVEQLVTRTAVTPAFYLATTVALLGVAMLTQSNGFSYPSLGDFLMLLAAVVRAVHVTVMHKLTARRPIDSGRLTLVQLATVMVVFLVVSTFIGDSVVTTAASFTSGQWVILVYLALMCTVFAFFVQMWAVRRTSPSRVSLLLGTEPVWAAAIGIAFAGDRLTAIGAIGAVLILVGINWGRRLEQRQRTVVEEPVPVG